jgi:hypothetical protein
MASVRGDYASRRVPTDNAIGVPSIERPRDPQHLALLTRFLPNKSPICSGAPQRALLSGPACAVGVTSNLSGATPSTFSRSIAPKGRDILLAAEVGPTARAKWPRDRQVRIMVMLLRQREFPPSRKAGNCRLYVDQSRPPRTPSDALHKLVVGRQSDGQPFPVIACRNTGLTGVPR